MEIGDWPQGSASSPKMPPADFRGQSRPSGSLGVLLELRFDVGLRYRANDLIDHLSALEEQQRRNRPHVEPRTGLDVRVDVQFCHFHLPRILGRELIQNWRDHPTRTAPGRPEVDDRETVVLLDLLLEIRVGDCNNVRHGTPWDKRSALHHRVRENYGPDRKSTRL